MPFFILSLLIQVALVIHVVKTGKNTTWIWIVVMLPLAGSIAYFVLEILPELTSSRAGRSTGRKVRSAINPNSDINAAAREYAQSDTVANSVRLAEECCNKAMFLQAKELYLKCLTGIHASDPALMFGLAKSDFGLNNFSETKATLDKLIQLNPEYKNQEAHLLYARALEMLTDVTAARHEYETLQAYYSGPDACYFYGVFLISQGQLEQGREVLQGVLEKADHAGKHYQSLHKEILKKVKASLKG